MPAGANFWVRLSILERGFRYNEAVGPRPTNRIMGSESTFLITLRNSGYGFCHVPEALVWHRVDPQYLDRRIALVRGFRLGRGLPYKHGLSRAYVLERTRLIWIILQLLGAARYGAALLLASLRPVSPRQFERQLGALVGLGSKSRSASPGSKRRLPEAYIYVH